MSKSQCFCVSIFMKTFGTPYVVSLDVHSGFGTVTGYGSLMQNPESHFIILSKWQDLSTFLI